MESCQTCSGEHCSGKDMCFFQGVGLDNWGGNNHLQDQSIEHEIHDALLAQAAYNKYLSVLEHDEEAEAAMSRFREILIKLGWEPTQEYHWTFLVNLVERALQKIEWSFYKEKI